MLTTQEVKAIYANHGVWMSERDLLDVTEGCNENGAILLHGLSASGWAHRWAREEVSCSLADAAQAAREDDRA